MSAEGLRHLGRYELGEVLGRGAMGVVYKAHDSFLDRTVAVKTYRQDIAATETIRRRFEREVKTASKLSHPNIVTVYDGGMEGDIPFLAMEYIEGSTLEAEMRERGRLPLEEGIEILFQISEGLDYAHRKGVIHRDLKPANILLSTTGQPKIADFGVAKVMTADTGATLTPVGTPSYMSPEQIGGKAIDARADIFALGVLAYEILTGEKPFEGDTWTTVLFRIMNEEPPAPTEICPDLPKAIDRVIGRAMAKDVGARTSDAATFARELRGAVQLQTPAKGGRRGGRREARGEGDLHLSLDAGDLEPIRSLSSEKPKSSGRRPWLVPIVGVVAVLVAGLGILLFLRRGGATRPEPPPQEVISEAPATAEPTVAPRRAPSPILAPQPVAPAATAPPRAQPTTAPRVQPTPIERPQPTATPRVAATPTQRPTPKPSPTLAPTPTAAPPPTETAVPAPRLATMDVIAAPPGAEVLVNGTLKGRAPIRVSDLPPGTYEFEIRKEGYVSYRRTAELEENAQYEMKVTLVPVVNSLRIVSEPPGVDVTVNGEPKGKTPLMLSELASGKYEVAATYEGRSKSQVIELKDGELGEVRFTFPP